MIGINTNIPIITLNTKEPKTSIKRQRLLGRIQKKTIIYFLNKQHTFNKMTQQNRKCKNLNINLKNDGVAKLILDRILKQFKNVKFKIWTRR